MARADWCSVYSESGKCALLIVPSVLCGNCALDMIYVAESSEGGNVQSMLQIFNLDLTTRMKNYTMNESVLHWCWLDIKTVGIVTAKTVYTWTIEGQDDPVAVFERAAEFVGAQILSLRSTPDHKWFTVNGIKKAPEGAGVGVVGVMQLYSTEKGASNVLPGQCSAIVEYLPEGATKPGVVIVFAARSNAQQGIMLDVAPVVMPEGGTLQRITGVQLQVAADSPADFPMRVEVSTRFGLIFIITRDGNLYIVDLETGFDIFRTKISSEQVFASVVNTQTGGILTVNQGGQVADININEGTIVQYLAVRQNNPDLAIKLAARGNLPGADDLIVHKFQKLFAEGRFDDAARVAATSPRGILRSQQTVQRFQQLPNLPDGRGNPALLTYFRVLLSQGQLNEYESVALATPAIHAGKKDIVEDWIKQDRLTCTEALGNLVRQIDIALAKTIFERAKASARVVECLAQLSQFEELLRYVDSVSDSFTPDWLNLIVNVMRIDPSAAVKLAIMVYRHDDQHFGVDADDVVTIFLNNNLVQQATEYMLDFLRENEPHMGPLQTRLLEVNLRVYPQVAVAILDKNVFHLYDRAAIAAKCEEVGLVQAAMEHVDSVADMRRLVVRTDMFDPAFLPQYFSKVENPQHVIACLEELMNTNPIHNLGVVVAISSAVVENIGLAACLQVFDTHRSFEGVYHFLKTLIASSEDPAVHFRYIEAAAHVGDYDEVLRVCRESQFYDPVRVRDFLQEYDMRDQLPLIIVCDRHDMVEELTRYLFSNSMENFIVSFLQKINTQRAPIVCGALLDMDADEDFILKLVNTVRHQVPVKELVETFASHSRLKLLQPALEEREREGATDVDTHNALGMVYVEAGGGEGSRAEQFLRVNQFYEPDVLGEYCTLREPQLAFLAFSTVRDTMDDEKEGCPFPKVGRCFVPKRVVPSACAQTGAAC